MYVGRIVMAGRCCERDWVGYRVSSRSFPNRRASPIPGGVMVSPVDPADLAKNPYISYACIRVLEDAAVVSNGDHTDMIADRLADGSRPLDAMALSLTAYGYERDELKTPRIAAVVKGGQAIMGISAHDEIRVRSFSLADGDALMVATYEKTEFDPVDMEGTDAVAIARAAYGLPFERPVCAAAARQDERGFLTAVYNPA
ncbi:MAG: IMP cyclohydrolase [Methanosaeta sp. PtaB.Bin039]|nr:MAG: IMP cyclohydrolase [Methanosaeta sp. PtaB.Bin039]OPY46335.1 MAG: IMP cyclohydrolase [Methanosaeta sp. PtaU1.Bin028]HOT07581.1 IMP cyclohydrolase [Methanotrichaceae archaeon]HQF17474.1 IMP cyclohydrolase [Methanotrichaceae archaeon]HQI92010.1 IMP cyclohydrolase [Methanotrichaceae archaeon]